ncbi:uncharacterized protein LOC143432748 isoform X2 [Xylocopa sonorina]|uniref:uncharacterized protein LOC143432748 isoform X2 n=1 Tax=Xylocopa sonorina TaxID=1818115 RepID=UPI00403AA1CE
MKICITCVYWTLLFISVTSSALLFIIVASENTQINHYTSIKTNGSSKTYDNDTLNTIENDDSATADIPINEVKDLHNLESNFKDHDYQEKFKEESADFETIIDSKARGENPYKDPDIVAESLTQQPNLSQGISENEQATLLTLVDTTVAELQSLAEPKLTPDFARSRLFAKNSSILTKNTHLGHKSNEEQEKISFNTQSTTSTIDDTTEKPNETSNFEESLLLQNSVEEETPEVVIVRAEQVPITTDGLRLKVDDSILKVLPDEISKVDRTVTTPELSDIEAKARLQGDNRDEATAAVLSEGIVSVGSSSPHEDIPSFSEWTQKRLEEAEKKKTHPNASVQNSGAPTRGMGGMKVRSKNYASPDCGAKLVAANPEARSARSVLVSTRDEYMLNTCTSRIWFVVELCEAIQAKKIELANFELFSSSPKDFSVYISDRFPTRDWSPVGQFTAKDIKDIQSFALQPQLFGKFIKVELQTYYGSEHFCPISLFCAYGTSEFEVLETETENQIPMQTHTNVDDEEDSDEEEILNDEDGEPPGNLFGSARDAVLSIMKKAAEVLVKSSDVTYNNITNIQQSIDNSSILEDSFLSCTTPRYTILCNNCSDEKFAKIFELISCKEQQLNQMLDIDLVNRTLRQNEFCKSYGVEFETFAKRETTQTNEKIKSVNKYEKFGSTKNFRLTFITSILKSEYIAALCNILAIKERKVVMNVSHEVSFDSFKKPIKEDALCKNKEDHSIDKIKSVQHTSTTSIPSSTVGTSSRESKKTAQELSNEDVNKLTNIQIEIPPNSENITSQIKFTKTLEKEEMKSDAIPIVESDKDGIEEAVMADVTVPVSSNVGLHSTSKTTEEPITSDTNIENLSPTTASISITTADSNEFVTDDMVPDVEPLEFSDLPNKVENVERMDQEGKQGETADQEIKLSSQDSLALDNIISDLKYLEAETVNVQNGPSASSSVVQSTTSTSPPKESVFLRLSNRIKALERNMSLSGQYLEELSRRYKKQVEEMQRSLERTVSAMSEETRKRDERESKRAEEIAILKEEISNLSELVTNLLYDRDSWRGKISMIGQQILLICLETFVVYLILLYYWGKSNKKTEINEKLESKKGALRRKSAENFSPHMKKPNKRRPSEIASHIADTYRELMINSKSHETKKEKKKKRRKTTALVGHQTNVNNDTESCAITQYKTVPDVARETEIMPKLTSSVEILHANVQKQVYRRQKSAPESKFDWFNENVRDVECTIQPTLVSVDSPKTESINNELNSSYIENSNETNSFLSNISSGEVVYNKQTAIESSTDFLNSKNINDILNDTRLNITSSFMKTALSTRKNRNAYSNDVNGEWNLNSGNSDDKIVQVSPTASKLSVEKICTESDTTTNDLEMDQSDESRSSSVTSMSQKKEKKYTGFRKMVRKFF